MAHHIKNQNGNAGSFEPRPGQATDILKFWAGKQYQLH